jgi:hypothetical protein
MFRLFPTQSYKRNHKRYAKNRPAELKAVLENLDKYLQSLQAGVKPLQIKAGFIHPEPQGVVAIDQKGGVKNLAQTRLYIFSDVEAETLYLIAMGDKNSQKSDIQACREFVNDLLKQKASDGEDKREEI